MNPTTRDIPLPIRRALRQEAGFGCCVCGHPFVEYHHIVDFSERPVHIAADMMALCPIHHHQCTVGALDTAQQRAAKASPFNIQRGLAEGQLMTPSTVIAIAAGSIDFIGAGFKFLVDDESLLGIRSDIDRRLLLSTTVYSQSDELLMQVHDNEWLAGDPLPWDLEYRYNYLRLRSRARQIDLEIDARQTPVAVSGTFWRKGHAFTITPQTLTCDGHAKNVSFAHLAMIATTLQIESATGNVKMLPNARLGGGRLLSWSDRMERLQKGIDGFNKLCLDAKLGRNERCVCESGRKVKVCHPQYCA